METADKYDQLLASFGRVNGRKSMMKQQIFRDFCQNIDVESHPSNRGYSLLMTNIAVENHH